MEKRSKKGGSIGGKRENIGKRGKKEVKKDRKRREKEEKKMEKGEKGKYRETVGKPT